jgi:hypothetical protein
MNFLPCKANPDVWMKDYGTHSEYVCIYVDDLAVILKEPNTLFAKLNTWCYKLKGVGEILYQTGGDLYRNPNGTLVAWGGAKMYCKCITNQCESIFGGPPKEYTFLASTRMTIENSI